MSTEAFMGTDAFAAAMILEAERLIVGCQKLQAATTPAERTMWKQTILERVAAIQATSAENGETFALLNR